MSATEPKARRVSPRVTFAALLWCLLVLSVHLVLGAAACSYSDSSNCVASSQKNTLYRGVLVGVPGYYPLRNTRFRVIFASRGFDAPVGGFSTGPDGSFCIRWAEDGLTFLVGSRFVTTQPLPLVPQRLVGTPPAGCQSSNSGIPWNRSRDLQSAPEYVSVIVLDVVSFALLLIGLPLGVRSVGPRLRVAGLSLTVATTALAGFVWLVLPSLQ